MAQPPVEVIVTGIVGEARQNAVAALALPAGLIRNGQVDRLWLDRFVGQIDRKVAAALEPFGYYSAKIAARVETVENTYRIHVEVNAGPPVIVRKVYASLAGAGSSENALQLMIAAFPLKEGDVLRQPLYEKAKGDLQAGAQDLGYLDADYAVHEIEVDPAEKSAVVRLVLETGEKYYFDGVDILGAPDYPESYLRRFLAFKPGDVFSYAQLAQTQLRFTNSERFREVSVIPEKERAQNFKIPVRIALKQLPRRSLRPGIGYGTNTGARFSLRYRDLNNLHKAHELNSNLYISENLQGLATGYVIPDKKDRRSSTSAQLNMQREDIDTYTTQFIALELARNRNFDERRQGSLYVRFQQEDYNIGNEDSSSRYILPGIRFTDNHYDNLIRPTKGFRYAADLRGTVRALGSTTELLQVIGEASHVLSMPWRLSLYAAAQAGITFFSDPLTELPPSLRFFAGGDQSVRGYAYQSLGPKNAEGKVVGGKHLLTGAVELQRDLYTNCAVSTFYNAGNAFDSLTDFKLYEAVGIGLHYYTLVGALNLSLARQINVPDPRYRIHLTIGFQF